MYVVVYIPKLCVVFLLIINTVFIVKRQSKMFQSVSCSSDAKPINAPFHIVFFKDLLSTSSIFRNMWIEILFPVKKQ